MGTGKMKQSKRLMTYYNFCRIQRMALFATDLASRGLDLHHLQWVLQVDCPENITQYIHRVGRVARYLSTGRSMIFLLPEEKENVLQQFKKNNIPIKLARLQFSEG